MRTRTRVRRCAAKRACTRAHTHVHKCGVIKTHMLPADFLLRTLISAVVTSEGSDGTARHLDTHGILHSCTSQSTRLCVRVCARVSGREPEKVCVFVRCP